MNLQALISEARSQFSKIERVDPSLPSYRKLCALLDDLSDDDLVTVSMANIKWVSSLALNRCIRRGI